MDKDTKKITPEEMEIVRSNVDVSAAVSKFFDDLSDEPLIKSSRKGVMEITLSLFAAGKWDALKDLRNGRQAKK
jgi:hypothetical protein